MLTCGVKKTKPNALKLHENSTATYRDFGAWQFGVDNSETGQYFTLLYYIRYRRGIAGTGLVVAELEDSPPRVALRSSSSHLLEMVDESFHSHMRQTEPCTLRAG